jgi:ribokinase
LLAALRAEGIDADTVRVVPGVPTGLAMIAVDTQGENLIVVAPGANHQVGPPDVAAADAAERDILVISAEIPAQAVSQALARSGSCVFNLAPAPETSAAARALLAAGGQHLDWLVVNESEAAAVLGRPVSGLSDAQRAAAELTTRGPRHAVVTAGAHGAALAEGPAAAQVIDGFRVRAVDTVGAGDTFVGALAVALAAGVPAPEATRAAAAAGAAAVTRHGAQTAMPRPADILAATGLTWPVA